jgi:hypothetical protein
VQTTEELIDASFSVWSVSYQRKVGDWFFPELLVLFIISVGNSNHIASSYRMNIEMGWNGGGREWFWLNLRYYLSISCRD